MITIKEALNTVDQELVFEKVFGERPVLDKTYLSPFRKDNNEGCYFEWHNNILYFVDWASNIVNKDCVQAIMSRYNMRLKDAIDYVLSDIEHIVPKKMKMDTSIKSSSKTIIIPIKREYTTSDKLYWKRFGISIDNLTEDEVFPIKAVNLYSKSSWKRINYQSNSYCITVDIDKYKIYRPHEHGKNKWLSNVSKHTIGSISKLLYQSDTLIITKSYKDCRVIRNLGYECVWFQSEGVLPDQFSISANFSTYRRVIVLFDNDDAGLTGAINLVDYLKELFRDKKINSISSPYSHIKDISEMYCFKGHEYTKQFLHENTRYD